MPRIGLSVFALAWIAGVAYLTQFAAEAVRTTCVDPPPPGGKHRSCEVTARSFDFDAAMLVHVAGAVCLTIAAVAVWSGRYRVMALALALGIAALAPAAWNDLLRPVTVPR